MSAAGRKTLDVGYFNFGIYIYQFLVLMLLLLWRVVWGCGDVQCDLVVLH